MPTSGRKEELSCLSDVCLLPMTDLLNGGECKIKAYCKEILL